ncbi:MAG: beta-N-acetylhexosaminidase, partial [Cyclobacteriaceae bacterium]
MITNLQSLLLFITMFLGACNRTPPPPPPHPTAPKIIPQVVSLETQEGVFEITEKTVVGVQNENQLEIAALFFSHFKTIAGWEPTMMVGDGDIRFEIADDLANEAYKLDITSERISILSASEAGFFYALQTLRQLLPTAFSSKSLQQDTRWVVPLVSIMDQPRFAWRGFMLDVSRHFFEKEYIKEVLDQMAYLKLNTFHWHLTDDQGWRIEIKKYPKLTEVGAWRVNHNDHDENNNNWWGRPKQKPGEKATYGGYYTQDDINEIIAYAQERQITIIPEIDIPGHSLAAIAAHPEIACHPGPYYVATGGVFRDNTLCPGKEVTFEFVENVLNEVMDLFPNQYIHIGGDECSKEAWKRDQDCQNRMKAEGLKNEKELQSYFVKRVEKMINAKGKIMIGWDEILEGGLAPNATVMSWRGEDGGIAAASAGHDVIMTPSKFSYLDLKQGHTDLEPNFGYSQCLLSTCYNYNPIPESLSEQSHHILGIEGNLWSESLPDWDKATYMTFPRLFAVAENAWSTQSSEDWDDFIDRLYPQLDRLQQQKIRYATSAFNVWIDHTSNGETITIDLHTEANGLEIKYTLDGQEPTITSNPYTGPFELKTTANVKARAFRSGGAPAGKITQKKFFVHKGKSAKVVYHTGYQQGKKAGGEKALVDL